jgi:hypothetical protein
MAVRLFSQALVAILASVTVTTASAGLIVQGGSGGTIPNGPESNDILNSASGAAPAGFGANLKVDGPTTLQFNFVGFEAGWDNEFLIDGATAFDNDDHPGTYKSFGLAGPSVSYSAASAGWVPFSFNTGQAGSVSNGSNFDDNPTNSNSSEEPNFFVAKQTAAFGEGLFLALDDTGGSDDDNHDDMVIRVQEVPGPSGLGLMALGLLLGAGMNRRRH